MATSYTYCTHRDVKDVFPNVDDFDIKTPIYGWGEETLDSIKHYVAYNSGLMTQLFIDGKSQQSGKQTIGTTAATAINSVASYAVGITTIVVDDGTALTDSTYIKIGDEILGITAISTHSLTVVRGELGTTAAIIANDTPVYLHFQPSVAGDNLYDADNDFVILKYASDPNDLLMEGGEDFSTLMTRIMLNASRYVDARIDANLPRDQFKDKEGNFDYMIVRTAALCAAYFLVNAQDPTNPIGDDLLEEVNFNIDQFNSGKSRLSGNVTGDSSKGIVREVLAPQNSNGLHIVDTRGNYSGIYDLLKVIVGTGGVLGTSKFDVYAKDSDSLKATKVVDATTINGDYQSISGGLQIRFAGKNSSSVATANDEWEIEVWGKQEAIDDNIGQIRSTKMSRRG